MIRDDPSYHRAVFSNRFTRPAYPLNPTRLTKPPLAYYKA